MFYKYPMRILGLILILLASGQAHALTLLAAPGENNESSQTLQGQISIEIRDQPDFKIQYLAGPFAEPETPQADAELASQIATLQDGLGLDPAIPYFVEEGASPPPLPAAVTRKFTIDIVRIPHQIVSDFKALSANCAKIYQECEVVPQKTQKTAAKVFGVLRAGVAGYVWFSSGMPVPLAALLTASSAGLTYFSTRYSDTLQNAFNYKMRKLKAGEKRTPKEMLTIFKRQMIFDLMISNTLNALSGMRNTMLRTSTNVLMASTANNAFGVQKSSWLQGRQYLNTSIALVTSPLMYALQAYEAANHPRGLIPLDFIGLKSESILGPSVAISMGITLTMMASVWWQPEKCANALEK
ncbi:MAG: response regulator transcription factor, partial [Bdellovibrionales bacterium]|nr:response regulator transcription factor [Oligoflexia bacterium]